MQSGPSSTITDLLDDLHAGIAQVFGEQLVGLYVYGSLALGGFDASVSDIDLLAALTHDVTDDEFDTLRAFHGGFVRDHRAWDDRIEVAYVSVAALTSFKERPSRIAVISPGEPLHFVEAGHDWLVEWYLVRESDLPLIGPSPRDLIPPVSKEEFLEAIRVYAHEVATRADRARDRKTQAYVVLTMCRALYAHQVGEHAAKGAAGLWAQRELPEWGGLIRDALAWRCASPADDDGSSVANEDIVHFAALVDARCQGQV
jgi:predicted nucleotidyltransferase